MSPDERKRTLAALNDACREDPARVNGAWVWTPGVRALAKELQDSIRAQLIAFADFTPENDPDGRRDCGAFTAGDVRILWKIDCYNQDWSGGSEDPADTAKTARVLTIMLAEEY